ncbi:MAG: hypothetical protein ABL884_02890 [Methyloglobulus sp.]
MNRIEKPENSGNKSIKNLIVTALGSVAITLIILFSGLLPIRFEVDSTRLAETFDKTSLSRGVDAQVSPKAKGDVIVAENKGDQMVNSALNQEDTALTEHQDTVTLVIPPKQQLTYRLAMERDYDLDYSWRTDGKPLYSEFRGETKDAKGGEFKNFGKITSDKAHGFFIIPFTGNFGWYWDNKTDQAITVRLNTKGVYKTLGPVVQAAKG